MKKIMVVDDDKEILFTFKATLEDNNGYNVITANSGKKCFELLENKQIPDIIVLDILMPDMDGWEVQEKLRETPTYKNIPVIFMLTMRIKIVKLLITQKNPG